MEVWAFWLDQGLKAVITDSFEDRNNNASSLMSMAVTSKIQWTLKVCNCNTIVVFVTSRIFVCHRNNFHLCFRGWCWRAAGIGCWIVMTTFLSFEQTETQRHEKLLSWIYKYQLRWLDPVLVIDNNPELCQSTRNNRKDIETIKRMGHEEESWDMFPDYNVAVDNWKWWYCLLDPKINFLHLCILYSNILRISDSIRFSRGLVLWHRTAVTIGEPYIRNWKSTYICATLLARDLENCHEWSKLILSYVSHRDESFYKDYISTWLANCDSKAKLSSSSNEIQIW